MKTVDTLVPDIYGYMLGKGGSVPSEEEFAELGRRISLLLSSRFKERHEKASKPAQFMLRLSNYGGPTRKIQYDALYPSEDKYDGPTLLKFLIGDIYETVLLFIAEKSGHSITNAQDEVSVDGVPGHPDAVIDEVLVDVKSASKYAFTHKFVEGGLFKGDDPFNYIAQIKSYGKALGISDSGFLAANKETGELAFIRVPSSIQYDVEKKIKEVKAALASDVLAPRCYDDEPDGASGNRILNVTCEYCRHKDRCWSDANNGYGLRKFKYKNGIKSFTKVNKTPNVEEVTNPVERGS